MNGAWPRADQRVQQMLRGANEPKAVTSVSLDRRASVEAGSSSRPAPLTEISGNAASAGAGSVSREQMPCQVRRIGVSRTGFRLT